MPPTSKPQNDAVQDARMQFIQETVKDIKDAVGCLTATVRDFQLNYTKAHEEVTASNKDARRRLDEHDKDIAELREEIKDLTKKLSDLADTIKPLVITNKVVVWLAALVGAGVVVFIGALLTHEIQVVFH